MNFGPRQLHFIVMTALTFFVGYLQAFVLARFENPWLHIDLMSILVVYMAIEHFLLGAFVRLLIAAVLMQQLSAVPSGFYAMYFLMALVIANLISRHLVLHNFASQFLSFAGIFALKFALLFFVFQKTGDAPGLWRFLELAGPSFLVTTAVSVPLFAGLASLDGLFEFAATRDRKADLIENM